MAKTRYIVGKKYKFKDGYELYLEYSGEDCTGDNCTVCGKELLKGYCFADTINGNPSVREVYGAECIKKVLED